MKYHDTILETVGHTPLVRLNKVADGLPVTLLAKVEALNPGGSVKDRIGLAMIEDAERRGRFAPGGTIIEATAGNTGVGLGAGRRRQGLPLHLRAARQDERGEDRPAAGLRRRGRDHPDLRAAGLARELQRRRRPPGPRDPRRVPPEQFTNRRNPEAHYLTTGPEIWRDTDGRIDVFVAGMGTGGTISGVGRVPEGAQPGRPGRRAPTPRARSCPATARDPTRSRASARTSSRRPSTGRSWTSWCA